MNNDQTKQQPVILRFESDFINRWLTSAVFFFLMAAIWGTSMRYFFVREIPLVDYKHLLHAHSHVALLGWGFLVVSGALIFLVVSQTRHIKHYLYVLRLNIISAIGMLVMFTIHGYGFYSIFFSCIHLVAAYLFAFYFLKDLNYNLSGPHMLFVKWSIYWMFISTLGLWAIAPVSILLGKHHILFYMSVQFFLHFQFNGWFTYAILGIWIQDADQNKGDIHIPQWAFWGLNLSLLLTYALSITWSNPLSVIFYTNSFGVLLQCTAYYFILKPIFSVSNPFKRINSWPKSLIALGIVCLIARILIQIAVTIPQIATISYTIRNYVIGFIHLIMLGSVTFTCVGILLKKRLLPVNRLTRAGWIILGLGFLGTELLLFGQGTLLWMHVGFMPYYYEILLGVTSLLPIALILVSLGFSRKIKSSKGQKIFTSEYTP